MSSRLNKRKYIIPEAVKKEALLALQLKQLCYHGGTETGIKRAKQLAYDKYIDEDTLKIMSAWFARHGPEASNGGTSYPGYEKWIKDGRPVGRDYRLLYRGAVAWLLWGGSPAFYWVKKLGY